MGVILESFFRGGGGGLVADVCFVFNDHVRSLLSESAVLGCCWRGGFGRGVVLLESMVEEIACVCLANELRRNADDSETRRRDFKSTL